MRTVNRQLRMAWLEYQDPRDGAVFTHGATTRLGFENAFATLPGSGDSRTRRRASNLPKSRFELRSFRPAGGGAFQGFLGHPATADQSFFEQWFNSPAVEGEALSSAQTASQPLDLLAVSGHGSNGLVWREGTGAPEINLASAVSDQKDEPRSGRLKCLLIASCNNLHGSMAPIWLPLFNHPDPIHLMLGYELSYSGGAIGARVMARFVDTVAASPSTPFIDAWRQANDEARLPQPWAAFVARGAEGMNLQDWVAGRLPALSNVTDVLHYSSANPSGSTARFDDDENYRVRWVLDDGTVVDNSNNGPSNIKVGLFEGRNGKISIRSKRPAKNFIQGQETYLFIHRYREDKDCDANDLLAFDQGLLDPQPETGKPVVTPVEKMAQLSAVTTGFRIVAPRDSDELELGFRVLPKACSKFKADGPGGSHGVFHLDYFHDYQLFELFDGREVVTQNHNGHTYSVAFGILLRP